ncbi:MAG: radical SAM protein [Deltaproteobacteria bacterium]
MPAPPEERTALARIRASHPFDLRPLLAVWETTLACDHACAHCRDGSQTGGHDNELTTAEGLTLIAQVASMGTPQMVLAGGDPAKRADLEVLVAAGASAGMKMAVACAATPLMSNDRLASLALAGVTTIAISLDGPDAALHDARRYAGSFAHTLRIVGEARALGLELQIETTIGPHNYPAIEAIAQRAHAIGAAHWAVHVSVPRGREREDLAQEGDLLEHVLHHVAEIGERGYFEVRVTHAPHFRRIMMLRRSPEVAAGILRDVDG